MCKRLKMKTIILVLLCLSIFGCKSQVKNDSEGAAIVFSPLKEVAWVEDLTPWVDTLFCVIPESLIPTPLFKMLIDASGNMYMLGFRGDLISLTPDGKKFRHFANRGRARNEYVKINDIALRKQPSELLILDEVKVISFGIDDSLSFKTFNTPVGLAFDALAPAGEKNCWLFSAFPKDSEDIEAGNDCLLKLVDEKGEILKEALKREDCTVSLMNITQSADNVYYLKPQDAGQLFYQLGADSLFPRYKIDFGDRNIPARYYYDAVDSDMAAYMRSPYFKQPGFAHETKTHFYFKCAGPDALEYNFLMDKRKPGGGIGWINRDHSSNLYIIGSDEDYFYIIFNKHELEEYDETKVTNLLYRYIVQSLGEGDVFKDSDEVIVKMAFR